MQSDRTVQPLMADKPELTVMGETAEPGIDVIEDDPVPNGGYGAGP